MLRRRLCRRVSLPTPADGSDSPRLCLLAFVSSEQGSQDCGGPSVLTDPGKAPNQALSTVLSQSNLTWQVLSCLRGEYDGSLGSCFRRLEVPLLAGSRPAIRTWFTLTFKTWVVFIVL